MKYEATKHHDASFQAWLREALHTQAITKARYDALQLGWSQQLQVLVKQWNKGNSTCIQLRSFQYLMDHLDYVLLHGITNEKDLNPYDIVELYERGCTSINQDIHRIHHLCRLIQSLKLSKLSDAYRCVVYRQLPTYVKKLEGKDGFFYANQIKDDLDYPLLDGLPLFHDMYHLQGSDLVLEYSRRLAYETQVCLIFQDELPQVLDCFEHQHGLPFYEVTCNLCEIVLRQVVAYAYLYHTDGISLQETDIHRLTSMRRHDTGFQSKLYDHLQLFLKRFPKQIRLWVSANAITILSPLCDTSIALLHTLIYETKPVKRIVIQTHRSLDQATFAQHLSYFAQSTWMERINFLQASECSIFDLYDFLEQKIFVGQEAYQYITTWTKEQIAMMLHVLIPQLSSALAFQSLSALVESIEYEADSWIAQFIRYWHTLSPAQLESIEAITQTIQWSM